LLRDRRAIGDRNARKECSTVDYADVSTWDWDALSDEGDPHTVVIVNDDDWEGLYIGGKLRYEHHHVRMSDINDAANTLGISHVYVPIYTAYVDGIAQSSGGMPERLSDVKRYIDNPESEGDEDDE
jgi:hypothetical protein